MIRFLLIIFGFNTQPPEGGCRNETSQALSKKRFNTQPPEGGCSQGSVNTYLLSLSFNTQPPEGGCELKPLFLLENIEFQHTAARRRLQIQKPRLPVLVSVSTHSRPKAAATSLSTLNTPSDVSTHSRPKAAAELKDQLI